MMVDEWWIEKNVEEAVVDYFKVLYPSICLEGLRIMTKSSVRIAGLRAEIWTRELSNTKQEY
jgi:hypothetical protein